MVLGVQDLVADFLFAEQPGKEFRGLDGGGAHQDRLTAVVTILDVLDDRVELVAPGQVDQVRGIVPDHFHVGRDHHHFQTVNLLELVGFGVGGAGHARQLVVEAEIVLERDRRDGLVLLLDAYALLGLDRLVQTIGPAPARHGAAGEFVHDHDLAVLDDVLHFLVEQGVRAQRGVQVVHEPDIGRVVEALALVEDTGPDQQWLDALVALLGQMSLPGLLVDGVVAGDDEPASGRTRSRLNFDQVMTAIVGQFQRRVDGHLPEILTGDAGDAHPPGLDILVGPAGRRTMGSQPGDELVDLEIELGALRGRSRDDQGRSRLVDENAVHLVDDGVVQFPLDPVFQADGEIVPQVVETEFVVGAVSDVRLVGFLLVFAALAGLDDAHRQPQELVDRAHPVRVPLGQVVVHRNDVHAPAGQCVEVGVERRHQRLALAGAHLGDLALVKRDPAHQLHVEVAHADRTHGGFPDHRERLGQERIQVIPLLETGPEFPGFFLQRVVIQRLDFRLQGIRPDHKPVIAAQQALVAAAEDVGEELGSLFQQTTSRCCGSKALF